MLDKMPQVFCFVCSCSVLGLLIYLIIKKKKLPKVGFEKRFLAKGLENIKYFQTHHLLE